MIEIKSLNKYYGVGNSRVHAVNDASLTLPDHGIVAIFGKSGCGKTTLLNLIGGLDTAQSGTVTIDGERITPDSSEARNRHIGYIFQNYNLTKSMTVWENVALSLRLCGVSDEATIEARTKAALQSVDMEQYKNRLPDSLSGGQQQRVAIARALVKNPRLILADEPTGNLDEQNTVLVMDLLRQVAKDHLVLLVTHEEDLVDYYCDLVVEVADGKIVGTRKNDVSQYASSASRDIYLGDMEHKEIAGDAVEIDYYGPARSTPAKIRLISVRGTLYLQADPNVKLRVLDDSAEIKVHTGTQEKTQRTVRELDPALRGPLATPHRAGRMFSLGGAIRSGFRAHFSGVKKSKKLMISGLLCFALVFVFLFSYFGHSLSVLDEIAAAYNADSVLVKTDAFDKHEKLQALLDQNKIDSVTRLQSYYSETQTSQMTEWRFGIGNFESLKNLSDFSMSFSETATVLDVAAARDLPVLAGKAQLSGTQILLSSGMADKLLKVAGVNFIEDYESLLYSNCSSDGHYYSDKKTSYTVVGIVEEEDACIYLTSAELAKYNLQMANYYNLIGVLPARITELLRLAPLGENEVYLCDHSLTATTLKISDKSYTVKANLQNAIGELQNTLVNEAIAARTPEFIDEYAAEIEQFIGKTKAQILDAIATDENVTYLTPYAVINYVNTVYSELCQILSYSYQFENEVLAEKTPDFIDEYATEIDRFLGQTKEQVLSDMTANGYAITPYSVVDYVRNTFYSNPDPSNASAFDRFLEGFAPRADQFQNEVLATAASDFIDKYAEPIEFLCGQSKAQILDAIAASEAVLTPHAVAEYTDAIAQNSGKLNWDEFNQFLSPMHDRANQFENTVRDEFWQTQDDLWRIINEMPAILCRAQDLPALSQAVLLATEDNCSDAIWSKLSGNNNGMMYLGDAESNGKWLSLHTHDVQGLLSALTFASADSILTPEQQYNAQKSGSQQDLLVSAISMIALAALMALCLYFIMRSTLMAAIKEIGTYRAIGVSRKNLIFKYLVETLVLFALTIFIGYAVSSGVLWWLLGTVKMLSSFLYYPVWMGVMTFVLLLAMSCVCGVLPIFSLLRKTPSEILSKYDI